MFDTIPEDTTHRFTAAVSRAQPARSSDSALASLLYGIIKKS